jgi:5'-3' exonuclease
MPSRLMLLDTASLYFRAFHGVPDTIRRPDGTPVNAVRGLLDMIARLVTEFEATHLVACWDDAWRPSWRVALIPEYKAHRVAFERRGESVEVVPETLTAQIPLIREVLAAAGIAVVGAPDHEADDVAGSYAAQAEMPVDVVTGDRDLFQLVDDDRGIRVIYTARGMKNLEVLTDAQVVAKYKVLPSQYVDYAVMRGDTSDGLPGVAGIGEKTASSLLLEHGTLDGLLRADAEGRLSAPVAAKLAAAADYLTVAPRVVTVVRDLELPSLEEAGARLRPVDEEGRSTLERLAKPDEWNLGGSVTRLLAALDATGE